MNVLILHDQVSESAGAEHADTLVQATTVRRALEELGHGWTMLALTLDLEAAKITLHRLDPDLVFNLVESLDGVGRFIHLPLHLLDSLHIPYTGVSAEGMLLTSNKLLAKQMMRLAGVPTPRWFTLDDLASEESTLGLDLPPSNPESQKSLGNANLSPAQFWPGRYIIKSVWEHASIGLDDGSIVTACTASDLMEPIENRLAQLGGEAFAEAYIDGREFNLALLAPPIGDAGVASVRVEPEILPPCEIVFDQFDPEKPRIVGYSAKWNENSFEYNNTLRRYEFLAHDQPLLERMKSIALSCWRLFNLRGHARADFRVDEHGNPWVLEINTNPCLSPDAGFAAALERASIPFSAAVERILNDVSSHRCRTALDHA